MTNTVTNLYHRVTATSPLATSPQAPMTNIVTNLYHRNILLQSLITSYLCWRTLVIARGGSVEESNNKANNNEVSKEY